MTATPLNDLELTALQSLNGLYVGQLTAQELKLFNRAVQHGQATRCYKGPASFVGVAKIRTLQCP